MKSIKEKVTIADVKNIFGNKNNAVSFLNTINVLNNKTLKNIDVF